MNPTNQAVPSPIAESPKQQATERLRQANNVLVTVSSNPSVDQLAACIGLTLLLNKMGKHATAVYSGQTPSTIGFLKPEETLEKNTDSLRDFIIALDKSKADKLRYKVEDKVVRIFITPYKTSLSEKDLNFSLGDFNVDAVVALGVHQQADLDQAIMAHGRILHDATVISLNTTVNNNLGTINWQDAHISSLSELVATLGNDLGKTIFDAQIATALLTGIVAETDRFSNNKTSSQTMSISAQLIAAGANQQLVAAKLEEPTEPKPPALQPAPASFKPPETTTSTPPPNNDGTLVIEHSKASLATTPAAGPDENAPGARHQVEIDEKGNLRPASQQNFTNPLTAAPLPPNSPTPPTSNVTGGSSFMFEPPTRTGTLTASGANDNLMPPADLSSSAAATTPTDQNFDSPGLALASPKTDSQDLFNLSNPLAQLPTNPDNDDKARPALAGPNPNLDEARHEVEEAVASSPSEELNPIAALGAQPVFEDLNKPQPAPNAPAAQTSGVPPIAPPVLQPSLPPLPQTSPPPAPTIQQRSAITMSTPPPASAAAQSIPNYGDEDAPSGLPAATPSSIKTADSADAPPPVPPPLTPPVF
jgi:hypothetical protein